MVFFLYEKSPAYNSHIRATYGILEVGTKSNNHLVCNTRLLRYYLLYLFLNSNIIPPLLQAMTSAPATLFPPNSHLIADCAFPLSDVLVTCYPVSGDVLVTCCPVNGDVLPGEW